MVIYELVMFVVVGAVVVFGVVLVVVVQDLVSGNFSVVQIPRYEDVSLLVWIPCLHVDQSE